MEITPTQEKRIGLYFHISVFLKGLFSLLEIIGGVLAFFVPVSYVTNVIVHLAQGELIEDPGDFISTHLVQLAQQLSVTSGTFIAIYLLSRGLVKFGLVVALLKNQLWAYPSSLVVLGLFIVYQMYQIVTAFSALLVFLTIFDLIVMWFIWKEYEVVRFEMQK
jgi:uncharacterized membrane protein